MNQNPPLEFNSMKSISEEPKQPRPNLSQEAMMLMKYAMLPLLATTVLAGGVVAQEQLPPPPPRSNAMPALPVPTPEQINRGRELLNKVSYAIANISITDTEALFKFFQFSDWHATKYPNYTRVVPKGKEGIWALPDDYRETEFLYFATQPWIKQPDSLGWLAHWGVRINTQEACVSLDDVQSIFGAQVPGRRTVIVVTDPSPEPPRAHDISALTYEPLNTPSGLTGGLTFNFDYQTCSTRFGFVYRTNAKEMKE